MEDYNETSRYVTNAIDLNRYSNRLSREMVEIYVEAANRILEEFRDKPGATPTQMARIKAQASQIEETISSAFEKEYPVLLEKLREVANGQVRFNQRQLKKALKYSKVKASVRSVAVSVEYVQAVASGDTRIKLLTNNDQEIIRDVPRILPDNEETFDAAFKGLVRYSSASLLKGIRSQLLLGKTNPEIVNYLLRKEKIPKGSDLKKVERGIKAMVRAAVIGVAAEAQLLVLEANKDITSKYEFVATLDSRTSPICQATDGKIFEAGDPTAPRPPLHYNCRSIILPSLKDFYKKNNIPPPMDTRPENGDRRRQIDADVTYEEWLKEQTTAFQEQVLGPGKAKCFREGFSLSQLVREDGSEIPLKELNKRRN